MRQHAKTVPGSTGPRNVVLAVLGWCVLGLASTAAGDPPTDRRVNTSSLVQVADGSPNVMYRLPPIRQFDSRSDWKPISVVIPPKLIPANAQLEGRSSTARKTLLKADSRQDLNQRLADASADFQAELEHEFETPPERVVESEIAVAAQPVETAVKPSDPVTRLPLVATPIADYTEPVADPIAPAPAPSELTMRMLPSIRQAYALGQRGALFASRAEFVAVLRRIATAKDMEQETDQYSRALSDGLRAVDEAEDLMPGGTQLTDMDLAVVTSSHRTPVLKDTEESVLPHQAAALYHEYAQRKLGEAVAGEQAGSMALHGLGKIYNREADEAPNNQHAIRNSMTMYRAALSAHPENHLAANELGVLLARNGHQAEAADMFERVIELSPNATAYHNLAVVQQKLGETAVASVNEQRAQAYAQWETSNGAVSRRKGIRWVSPEQMALAGGAESPPSIAQVTAPPAVSQTEDGRNAQPGPSRMVHANAGRGYRERPTTPEEESPSTWDKIVNAATFGKTRTASNNNLPMGPPRRSSVQAHGHTSAGTFVR